MDSRGADKKERLLAALDQGMVMIHLDARRPGVAVPAHLKNEAHLRLNLSYRFDPPDLSVGDWGVRCTLSFGGSRAKVAVPWSALFAVASHVTREFWLFPEDMPPELLQHAPPAEASAPRPALVPAPVEGAASGDVRSTGLRPVLREVPRDVPREPEHSPELTHDTPQSAAAPASEEGPSEPPPRPGRGHLRLVK
jgi:stringent starvation protein B